MDTTKTPKSTITGSSGGQDGATQITKQRTAKQNRALHKACEMLAEELNSAGLDQRKVLKPSISISWTKESIKKQMFARIQEAMFGTDSTTLLTTKQLDQVWSELNRHLSDNFGVQAVFPSIEQILLDMESKKRNK